MPLGQGIVGALEAIPTRIEVAGHGPVYRITAGSFEAALDYARKRFGAPVVVAAVRRDRWWPRVTLTVSTEASAADAAPALETLRAQVVAPPVSAQHPGSSARPLDGAPVARASSPGGEVEYDGHQDELFTGPSMLEEIFAHQEELRQARLPQQRPGRPSH